MCFQYLNELPTPEEIKKRFPLTDEMRKLKEMRDKEIIDIMIGRVHKFLVIIGPCSADNEKPVLEYLERLAFVQEKIKDKVFIIPRIYTNKPRTDGRGYKGIIHQPHPLKGADLMAGLTAMRRLHLRAIEISGFTSADEMLYPENWVYLSDLLSYVAIGARSVENQQHRLTVSGMDIPVGMKNPTSGDLSVMMNSIIAAQNEHRFIFRGWEVKTEGNLLAHAILRGSVDKNGNNISNYHYEDLLGLIEKYEKSDLLCPAAIIDTNHSNSGKKHMEQIRITEEILHSRNVSADINKLVKGVMIESYLESGNQPITNHPLTYGKSITDPCLGWEDTEKLLFQIAELC